jgi:hypothetical protein
MSKIISYARNQFHGVSDPLSGATLPISNDHTDGSWTITDIYDREIMINTGNGNLQYRAGADIYTVQASPTSTAIKTVTAPIGTWDMTTVAAINAVTITIPEVVGKTIVGLDFVLMDDGSTGFLPYTWGANGTYDYPLRISIENSVGVVQIDCIIWTSNGFRRFADTLIGTFEGNTVNRGYVTVTYID